MSRRTGKPRKLIAGESHDTRTVESEGKNRESAGESASPPTPEWKAIVVASLRNVAGLIERAGPSLSQHHKHAIGELLASKDASTRHVLQRWYTYEVKTDGRFKADLHAVLTTLEGLYAGREHPSQAVASRLLAIADALGEQDPQQNTSAKGGPRNIFKAEIVQGLLQLASEREEEIAAQRGQGLCVSSCIPTQAFVDRVDHLMNEIYRTRAFPYDEDFEYWANVCREYCEEPDYGTFPSGLFGLLCIKWFRLRIPNFNTPDGACDSSDAYETMLGVRALRWVATQIGKVDASARQGGTEESDSGADGQTVMQKADVSQTSSTIPSFHGEAMMSAKKLAEVFKLEADPVRKRLERWRAMNMGSNDWTELPEREWRRGGAKYLYRFSAIKHLMGVRTPSTGKKHV